MIHFILGIITGLLIAFLLLALEAFLGSRGKFLGARVYKSVEKRVKAKGAVLMPLTETEEIIKIAGEKGEDLNIEEL